MLRVDYLKNKKSFRNETKSIFLALQVLSFIHAKQTSKNVADTTFKEIQSNLRRNKLDKVNQSSNFLRGSFSIRNNLRAPIQVRREVNCNIFNDDFSSRTDPSIFTSIAPVLLDQSFLLVFLRSFTLFYDEFF